MPTPRRLHSSRVALIATVSALVLVAVAAVLLIGGAGKRHTPVRSLQDMLLGSGEQPGFSVTSPPEAIRLTQPGFKSGVQETLGAPDGRSGFTLALKFKTPADAQTSAAHYLGIAKAGIGPLTRAAFTVPGVAGTHGFTGQGKPVGVADAYWTVGRCLLGSGVSEASGAAVPSAAALAKPVIAGIQSQSKRIDGHCP
jgi:hypothetical protein